MLREGSRPTTVAPFQPLASPLHLRPLTLTTPPPTAATKEPMHVHACYTGSFMSIPWSAELCNCEQAHSHLLVSGGVQGDALTM